MVAKSPKNIKALFWAVSAITVAVALLLLLTWPDIQRAAKRNMLAHKPQADGYSNLSLIQNTFYERGDFLSHVYRQGKISPDDFEKLDFSLPGDPAYGDDPTYEVFNPEGPYKIDDAPPEAQRPFPPQKWIDELTTVKNTRLIYNIRRHVNRHGIVRDDLVLIIPNAKCKPRQPLSDESAVAIAPDNRQALGPPNPFIGGNCFWCYSLPADHISKFRNAMSCRAFSFAYRYIKPGDTKWQK